MEAVQEGARPMSEDKAGLSIIVVGASGDLARKKIFPALFALYSQGFFPPSLTIMGFARTGYTDEAFRAMITEHLTCRYVPEESCAEKMNEFLARCYYVSGQYNSRDSFLDLYEKMRELEGSGQANRMFYLAIPPSIFLDVARAIGGSGMVSCDPRRAWSRVVIEKPFGRDRASSDVLTRGMAQVFTEDQTFRIDHYLGKEVIQNLQVLRFANLIFEPVWNRDHVRSVQICWQEDLGVEGRGGYFDQYGIIRDVMQNHLLQILALLAMELPSSVDSRQIRNEKVRVLRSIPPLAADDIVVGQYTAGSIGGRSLPAYVDDETVADDSTTPTYGAAALRIENERWQGVPFLIRAGKGLASRMTEIRIRFRGVPVNVFCRLGECPEENELVIRVQPDEAITLRITNKVPGLGMVLAPRDLDLRYKAAFDETIPDAYENLLLDVMRGEKSLFIRSDELAAAWDIFTPALREIEARGVRPEPYAFGSRGPAGADGLAARFGVAWE